jgi:hypothetical protein
VSTAHVPVSRSLRLEPPYEAVYGYLRLVDPDLRIRKSAERAGLYVLERRCRRAPAVNIGMRDCSDMHVQARDGYIHVATTNTAWLLKPWNMIRALKEEGVDLWAAGGAQTCATELEYEEQWAKVTRRRRRQGLYRDIASEGYDILSRMNIHGERSRISAPGVPTTHTEASSGRQAA